MYEAERTADGWTEPKWIASLNRAAGQKWSDGDPAISGDGRMLIYSSNRTGNDDLFISYRSPNGWSSPVRLSDDVNSSAGEYLPWLDPDGNLYFETNRRLGGDRFDIYMAPRQGERWGKAEPVPGLSTDEAAESSPFISRDGRLLLFIRKPGDIMLSERLGDRWSQPRNLNVGFKGSMQFRPTSAMTGNGSTLLRAHRDKPRSTGSARNRRFDAPLGVRIAPMLPAQRTR